MLAEIPRFFQEVAPSFATIPMWQRKLSALMALANGSVLQKCSATDDGCLFLGLYKPGSKRYNFIWSVRKNGAGFFLEEGKVNAQSKPNSLVQVIRKYLMGRRITSVWGSICPATVVFEFSPVDATHPDAAELAEGPDTLLLDLDAKPARICLVRRTRDVPDRYANLGKRFRQETAAFLESFCEWSTESTKTKRRATFEEPLVGLCFLPLEIDSIPTQKQTVTAAAKAKQQKSEAITLTHAFALLPPHIRRAAKTRYQFLERRLTRQRNDLPNDSELSRLEKRSMGLQANLYLWPKDSPTWYVPAELIAEFSLPAFFKLKLGQRPGDLLADAFHELERTKRRRQELETRIAQSELACRDFSELVLQAGRELEAQLTSLEPEFDLESNNTDRVLATHAHHLHSDSAQRICQICEVPWQAPAQKRKSAQKAEATRLPYRTYFAFTGEFIRVAKSAEDGDTMLRQMPANHYWLHVLTGEGSHVWLERPRGRKPSPRAIRDACIVAIHHSRQGKGLSGEVRFATRADIEKKKKLPVGKVLVHRCETLTCKYTDTELQRILATYHERNH